MGSKPQSSNQKIFIATLIVISSLLCIFFLSFKPLLPSLLLNSCSIKPDLSPPSVPRNPPWFRLIKHRIGHTKIRVGFVNIPDDDREKFEARGPSIAENVHVSFDPVPESLQWKDLFPQWIDEDEKYHKPRCPEIPLPPLEGFRDLDVVVAKVPCERYSERRGFRDVFRLQVNLVAANLAVESGWFNGGFNRTVYVVLVGSCGAMQEIFRCDDLVRHVGDYWVYKPDVMRLKHKLLMPVGSCQIGKEASPESSQELNLSTTMSHRWRQAYATVLHSSEAYVCGAIALAQSIKQSGSTHDLILLHDDSIAPKSRAGLRAAGWRLKKIQRIRSPFSKKNSYNEWNYSKLRVWQLTEYDKVIFVDADFIVLKNLDHLFDYPQLSAAGNNKELFNSGVMVLEPSKCLFEYMLLKSFKVESYNGGDQGFLNEIFAWWHRLPKRVNHMKFFGENNEKRGIPDELLALHYLGIKPWACYRDYDCNWDMKERHEFASDSAHEKWWEVYDKMPKELQTYCALSPEKDARIRKWRGRARKAALPDRHWEIEVKDPRKGLLVE